MHNIVLRTLVIGAFLPLVPGVGSTVEAFDAPATGEERPILVWGNGIGSGRVTSAPSGIDCEINAHNSMGACAVRFAVGTVVVLTPEPDSGQAFLGWSGACTGTGACQITVQEHQWVFADFAPAPSQGQHGLEVKGAGTGVGTVHSSPRGVFCAVIHEASIGYCSVAFAAGDTVMLQANPVPGNTFVGWSGACTGADPCMVSMTADQTVTARFVHGG